MWVHTDPLVGTISLTRDPTKTAGISVYCTALGWDLERAFFDMELSAEDSAWERSFVHSEKGDAGDAKRLGRSPWARFVTRYPSCVKSHAKGLAAFWSQLKRKDLPELLIDYARKLQTKLLEDAGFD